MQNNNAIISVGVGPNQLEFIQEIKKRGFKVISFGKGRNDSKAIELSDYFKEIDTEDYVEAINWIESLDVKVVGAGSYAGGKAVRTLQEISNHFKLPTSIPKYLIVGMEKHLQQKLCIKYGLSYLKSYLPLELKESSGDIEKDKDYIVKPTIGRGSEEIYYYKGQELTKKISLNEISECNIIQEVSHGEEYRTLIIIQDGDIKLLSPLKRYSFKDTFFLGKLSYCEDISTFNRIKIHAQKYISEMKIQNAIIKYDIIVEKNKINLIEMDIGVGGGVYFKKIISEIFNVNLNEVYVDLILGNKIEYYEAINKNLMMDYVYNELNTPVGYDLDKCYELLKKKYGEILIIENNLLPNVKSSFQSNSDFIFTIIYAKEKNESLWEMNDFINKNLFEVKYEIIRK